MIVLTRKWDLVKDARKRQFQADPQHPDVVPLQEALQLADIFDRCSELDEVRAWPDDFRDEVLARLLELNEQRAKEEVLTGGNHTDQKKTSNAKSKKAKTAISGQQELFEKENTE